MRWDRHRVRREPEEVAHRELVLTAGRRNLQIPSLGSLACHPSTFLTTSANARRLTTVALSTFRLGSAMSTDGPRHGVWEALQAGVHPTRRGQRGDAGAPA